jgi:CubicO group peptidase (beta-lactamase class C family)
MALSKTRCLILLCGLSASGLRPALGVAQQISNPRLSDALNRLDRYVNDAMARTKVPGASVAVVYMDHVVFLKGYGVREAGEPARVDPDTVFEIASFSKPIASTVVAELVGRGEVTWDSRIHDLDPGFQLSDAAVTKELTVRDLFSHRSTLPTDSGDTLEALGYTRPEILSKLRMVPLHGVFRKTFQYSNFGITEGALAATRHLGKTWEEVSEDLLYSKLGMTSTSSRFSDYMNRPNRAALHYLDPDGVFRARYVREADAEAPAGGVSSSARDLASWLRLQLAGGSFDGKQIVDRKALDETHSPQVCRSEEEVSPGGPKCPGDNYYGLGWNVGNRPSGERLLSHSGAFLLGAATAVYMIPGKQIGILVLTNGTPVGLPESIALNFLDDFEYGAAKQDYLALTGAAFTKMCDGWMTSSENYSTEQPPAKPLSGDEPSTFVGTYENPYFGRVEIEQQQGKLVLRLPSLGTYYELSHWNGNVYTYYIANESSGAARRGVEFSHDGRQITVQNLKFEYSNVFRKSPGAGEQAGSR